MMPSLRRGGVGGQCCPAIIGREVRLCHNGQLSSSHGSGCGTFPGQMEKP